MQNFSQVHAAIAVILHASGYTQYIDEAIRGLGEASALAKDGSTDIPSMMAASSLSVRGPRAGDIPRSRAESSDSKVRAQDVSRVDGRSMLELDVDEKCATW